MDASSSTGKHTFYISLLGADGNDEGIPRRFQFIFDLVTKWYEFSNTNVKFINLKMLCDQYEKGTGMPSSSVDVYTLSLHFIRNHPNSHFIFDEVPFTRVFGELIIHLLSKKSTLSVAL